MKTYNVETCIESGIVSCLGVSSRPVPAAFFAILMVTDRLGARRYPVPSVVLPWWFWLAVYFVLLGSGALAIVSLPMRHGWVRLCLAVAYIAVVGFVLLLLGSLLEVNGYHYSR